MAGRRRRTAEGAAAGTDTARKRVRVRALVVGAIVAAILGFGAGWLARIWSDRTPEERARDAVGDIQERSRELTR